MALTILRHLSVKTQTVLLPNQWGNYNELPGQKLTASEIRLQNQACDFLIDYFSNDPDGNRVRPDWWERTDLDRAFQERQAFTHRTATDSGQVFNCQCTNNPERKPNPKCDACHGIGKIIVTPFHGE
jgi:hypothetical protein